MTSTVLHSSPSHIPSQAPLSSDYDYVSFRAHASFSPCQINTLSATPPRKSPNSPSYASPVLMLSPSPLRRRVNFNDSAMDLDTPESFIGKASTPFRSSSANHSLSQLESVESPILFRRPEVSCDEEIAFFQSPYNAASVPVQTPDRHVLQDLSSNIAHSNISSQAHKRKVNLLSTTPHLTPLRIHHPLDEKGSPQKFARLAPLQAPQFLHSPTNLKVLKPESMLQMRIADKSFDRDVSSDEDESPQKNKVSIVESRSPGGHVTKRRARPRPGLRGLMMPPSPCPLPNLSTTSESSFSRKTHTRRASSRSNRDFESVYRPTEKPKNDFDRVVSSATLFFGPAIVSSESSTDASKAERPLVTVVSPENDHPPNTPSPNSLISDDSFDVFHHGSPNSSFTSVFLGPAESSFAVSVVDDSPSSRKSSPRGQVPKKYKKPRDSGVALTDEEGESNMSILAKSQTYSINDTRFELRGVHTETTRKNFDGSISTYFDSVHNFDNSFVTPGIEPRKGSAWPENAEASKNTLDEFIVKTLIAGGNDVGNEKRMPNTPQKRAKPIYLGVAPGERPWASATTAKVANVPIFGEKLKGLDFGETEAVPIDQGRKGRNRPRKTCPEGLRFPSTIGSSAITKGDDYEQRQQDSRNDLNNSFASMHAVGGRARTYGNVGLGRPLNGTHVAGLKAQALMRRSSSGAFSSSSESSLGTPTKVVQEPCPSTIIDSPTGSRHPALNENRSTKKINPSLEDGASLSVRRAPSHYSTVTAGIIGAHRKGKEKSLRDVKSTFWNNHLMPPNGSQEETGRFETEFIEVDEIGAGEFGRAMKVHYKKGYGQEDELFAIKISKRFEGVRHRIRLHEEVDILRHLSAASKTARHPNVLCYIDSWEQNEQLYILTELCEYGNFAHFLSEYGHHFARLDEARVWKIFAELSNGLRFIHNTGVIHLDFKPANIFITASGGFKIGDFGMASLWPRPMGPDGGSSAESHTTFEREGDKMYLAAEVLRGVYGRETDIFSFGMTMLETAANIVVPTQGELWHRLRDEDFTPVEGFEEECSEELVTLIKSMMRKDPGRRPDAEAVWTHPVIRRTRVKMKKMIERIRGQGDTRVEMMFKGSALAGVEETFLEEILKEDNEGIAMEVCADFIEEKRNSR